MSDQFEERPAVWVCGSDVSRVTLTLLPRHPKCFTKFNFFFFCFWGNLFIYLFLFMFQNSRKAVHSCRMSSAGRNDVKDRYRKNDRLRTQLIPHQRQRGLCGSSNNPRCRQFHEENDWHGLYYSVFFFFLLQLSGFCKLMLLTFSPRIISFSFFSGKLLSNCCRAKESFNGIYWLKSFGW